MRWLRAMLGGDGEIPRVFVVVALVDSIGTGMFLAGSTIFFVRSVGLTPAQVGLGLAVAGAVGFVSAVPIGALADRLGSRQVLVAVQLWRAASQVGLAFAAGPLAFTVLASCLAVADGAASGLTQSVVSDAVGPQRRVPTMAAMRALRNVGFGVGALATAPLLAAGTEWTYRSVMLGDALSFVVAAVLLSRVRTSRPRPDGRPRQSPLRALASVRDHRYLALAGLNGVLCLHMTVLAVLIPLWTIESTAAPAAVVPFAVVVNTVLAVVLQVRFSQAARGVSGGARALRWSGVAMAGACLLIAVTGRTNVWLSVCVLAVGVLLLTFGELWQSAGGWELSYAFADQETLSTHLAVFNLGTTAQSILGPALLAPTVLSGDGVGWLALSVVFVVVATLVAPTVTALTRALPEPVPLAAHRSPS
ncbi:MFS transporter [Plantactinospora sp. WMMC1484]|uniref:MFS transporter n=1 Tax=Plantactinospora sp. WMMC1484 TaxID=3404122 RepID=UPI003BF46095